MAIAKLSIDLEARFAKLDQDLRTIDGRIATIGGNLKNAFAGVAAAIGTGAIVNAFKGVVNSLDQIDESAERLGTTTENLSALGYAAKMNGIEFEELNKGLTKFTGLLADGMAGNKEAVETLERLGVSSKNFGNVEAAFAQFADTVGKTEQPVRRAGLLIDALGEKIGVKFGPMLANGSAGLAAWREEADKLGGVIDGKVAKQAAEFNDNLDRLGTLAGAAGKSIAGGLLPWLNQVAESFIISRKNAESLWEALSRPLPGTAFVDVQANLAKVRHEYEQLDYRISNGRAKEGDEERFARLGRELAYWQQIADAQNKVDAKPATVRVGDMPDPVKKKIDKAPAATATAEAQAYAKAMEDLARVSRDADAATLDLSVSQKALYDLMTSAEWSQMPDAWKQTAVAQFELAYASEQAADEVARLNRLLGDGSPNKLAETAKDMEVLRRALDKGQISEGQFFAALSAGAEKANDELTKTKPLAEELGLVFESSFENAIASGKGFSGVLKGLEQDVLRLITRLTITQPLLNAIQSSGGWGQIFGSLFNLGGSESAISAGSSTIYGPPVASAKGNVFALPSLSAYSGSIVTQPTYFAKGGNVMGEAGPEGIFPLKRGRDGRLGVSAEGAGGNVTVNVINNTDATAKTERRSDGKGGSIIDIVIERARGAIAGDIARGNGAVPAALEAVYGLNRGAGAY